MAACSLLVITPDTDADPNASGSFTPTAGSLIVVFVQAAATVADPGALTSSLGGSLTFTQVIRADYGTNLHSLYCFVGDQAATASSQTVSFTATGDAATGSVIAVYEITGVSKYGAAGIRQSAMHENRAVGNSVAPGFASNALTTNPTLWALATSQNPAGMTPPTNWTEDDDVGYNSPSMGLEVAHRDSGFTGQTITSGATLAAAGCGVIVEIDASSSVALLAHYYNSLRDP